MWEKVNSLNKALFEKKQNKQYKNVFSELKVIAELRLMT